MTSLALALERIRDELRERGNLEASDMHDSFGLIVEGAIGFGKKLGAFAPTEADRLPPGLKQWHPALVYAESICDLLSALAYDGLASVFYNWTNPAIARLRLALDRHATLWGPWWSALMRSWKLDWYSMEPGTGSHATRARPRTTLWVRTA
jgi:hypothetical protein